MLTDKVSDDVCQRSVEFVSERGKNGKKPFIVLEGADYQRSVSMREK